VRVSIGALTDFPDRRGVALVIEGRRVAVFRLGERIFAVDDRCAHRGFPLHDGTIEAAAVRCRTHGACFDLASGAVLRGPARRPIRAYTTAVVDGQVQVDIV
jgi:3-phenylpropionate/trans-cinnamate dioxygenase ferredoxin subunit